MNISRRLSRILKKSLNRDNIVDVKALLLKSYSNLNPAELAEFEVKIDQCFSMIDHAFQQNENMLAISQHNTELSSKEMNSALKRIQDLNQTLDAMVNSLGQGFALMGPDGVCLSFHSKACAELLEGSPAGKHIADVLRIPETRRRDTRDWIEFLFRDLHDFDAIAHLGERTFPSTQGKLEYVLIIATDKTEEMMARKSADSFQGQAALFTSIVRNKRNFVQFVEDTRNILNRIRNLVSVSQLDREGLNQIMTGLHTIKGGAGLFDLHSLQDSVHQAESQIAENHDLAIKHNLLRDTLVVLDEYLKGIRKAVRDVLNIDIESVGKIKEIEQQALYDFVNRARTNQKSPNEIVTDFVENLLYSPIEQSFSHLNLYLTDLAERMGKSVSAISIEGGDLRIYREAYDDVFNSFIHIFRNIFDHGIETREERLETGKSVSCLVSLNFQKISDRLIIEIRDDGRGLNFPKIRQALLKKGNIIAETATEEELIGEIFKPGVSTSQVVSELSGRGVGLSATKEAIEAIDGKVYLTTEFGKGCCFHISLPWFDYLYHKIPKVAAG